MTETIASLVGAIIGAIITTSFWFVQHRIEQKDDLNNEWIGYNVLDSPMRDE